MTVEQDPVERLRALTRATPGSTALIAAICALVVGGLMAAAAGLAGASFADLVLMGVFGGLGAVPAVYLFLR